MCCFIEMQSMSRERILFGPARLWLCALLGIILLSLLTRYSLTYRYFSSASSLFQPVLLMWLTGREQTLPNTSPCINKLLVCWCAVNLSVFSGGCVWKSCLWLQEGDRCRYGWQVIGRSGLARLRTTTYQISVLAATYLHTCFHWEAASLSPSGSPRWL